MRKTLLSLAVALAAAVPAHSAVVGFSNVSLLDTQRIFTVAPGTSFRFTYDQAAAAAFNPETYSVQTRGTAQTSAFGGFLGIPLRPSLFRTDANILIDNNLFPSFASFPALTPISTSLVPGDLGLRYTAGADTFFGYARLNGDGTLDFGFQDVANTAINAGDAITGSGAIANSVPEPGAWAMMLAGFGLAGAALRRRPHVARRTVAA